MPYKCNILFNDALFTSKSEQKVTPFGYKFIASCQG